MAIAIKSKIVGIDVKHNDGAEPAPAAPASTEPAHEPIQTAIGLGMEAALESMHERVERPESLIGSTYKVRTPLSEHAIYITINDIVLNPNTPYQSRQPFEIFINSKSMDHFQWIVALTRIISAVFRKGGDVTFLVEELRSVFDPRGGYIKRGGRYMPSLVAEIGDVIETHLRTIGLLDQEEPNAHQQALIDAKKAELAEREVHANPHIQQDFPPIATLCPKCMTKAVVLLDGCSTCLNCGDSKCG